MSLAKLALEDLFRRQCVLKEYLQEKVYEEDWHGVSDAANDLRVLEERIKNREEMIGMVDARKTYFEAAMDEIAEDEKKKDEEEE